MHLQDGLMSLIPVISNAYFDQKRHVECRRAAHMDANFIANPIHQVLANLKHQFIVHLQDDFGIQA
jgi:hypothetical protein